MKILCIGNNTVDTDTRTTQLADEDQCQSYGLLSELDGPLPDQLEQGYYHSSVYDIEYYKLLELAQQFDRVIILDQSRDQYSHPDAFYKTIRLANELTQTHAVIFLDPSYQVAITFFEELVAINPSFCIFPFIELLNINGNTTVCCRSTTEVTKLDQLKDFQTDPHYTVIRNKMLAGERIPEHCSSCYQLEDRGIVSARQQETVEWANRLNFTRLEDLQHIKSPAYYEVRPSNICNLQCRTCEPTASHLISQEYKTLNLVKDHQFVDVEYTNFDFIDFSNLKKLYVAGGEPTAMTEFYEFLDRCIQDRKTNFELLINTNGTKLSERFKQQLTHFPLVSFIISIDGYGDLNHYIRWPSNWSRIMENVDYMYNRSSISFNITVSIYNVARLGELITFLDKNFPWALVHCQFAVSPGDRQSALNFPYPNLVVEQLEPITRLNCYKNDRLLGSFIDGLVAHYTSQPKVNLNQLQEFFKFNDVLDRSRNIQLVDYIPELEQSRRLIQSTD